MLEQKLLLELIKEFVENRKEESSKLASILVLLVFHFLVQVASLTRVRILLSVCTLQKKHLLAASLYN